MTRNHCMAARLCQSAQPLRGCTALSIRASPCRSVSDGFRPCPSVLNNQARSTHFTNAFGHFRPFTAARSQLTVSHYLTCRCRSLCSRHLSLSGRAPNSQHKDWTSVETERPGSALMWNAGTCSDTTPYEATGANQGLAAAAEGPFDRQGGVCVLFDRKERRPERGARVTPLRSSRCRAVKRWVVLSSASAAGPGSQSGQQRLKCRSGAALRRGGEHQLRRLTAAISWPTKLSDVPQLSHLI